MQGALRRNTKSIGSALLLCLLFSRPAYSDDEFIASAQLRGGYDANPTLSPQKSGSAVAELSGNLAVAKGDASRGIGAVGDFSRAEYTAGRTAPNERYKLEFRAMTEVDGWSLRAATRAESARNYSVQSFDATQIVKVRAPEALVRPFATVALQYSTLNETNALLGDFLPQAQRFLRGTITPGIAVKLGKAVVGISADVSVTRYTQEPDLFGFRRNNERLEPFAFLAVSDQDLDFYASISRFYGRWHDTDFSNPQETMFDVSLSKKAGPLQLGLSAQRTAQDTTFPISPIIVTTRYGAEVQLSLTDSLSVRAFGRNIRSDYLDSPFTTSTKALGLGATYDLSDGFTMGAEIARIRGSAIDGSPIEGGLAMLSLKKVIAGAAPEPPAAPATNPSWDPRPVQSRHQP